MYLMGTWWVECGGDQKTVTIPRKRRTGSMTELSAPAARIHKLLVWRGTEGPVTDRCPCVCHHSTPDPSRNHCSTLYNEVTPEPLSFTIKPKVFLSQACCLPNSQANACLCISGLLGSPGLPAVLPLGQEARTHIQP